MHDVRSREQCPHSITIAFTIPSVTEPLPSSRNITDTALSPPRRCSDATSRSSATCSSYLHGCSHGGSPGAAAAITCSMMQGMQWSPLRTGALQAALEQI